MEGYISAVIYTMNFLNKKILINIFVYNKILNML